QREADFPEGRVDVGFGQLGEAGESVACLPEAFGQCIEHGKKTGGARVLPRGGRSWEWGAECSGGGLHRSGVRFGWLACFLLVSCSGAHRASTPAPGAGQWQAASDPRAVLAGAPSTSGPRVGSVPPTADVRFVGPGMVGPDVPHWPMFRHDAA